ncbi:MAG: hypothetical protein DRI90_01800 [Deltaproteobacteria bacterium]|nr:MAG: hypothetical protein DRI90_01800 [Deltaproteobacteria bacterium]
MDENVSEISCPFVTGPRADYCRVLNVRVPRELHHDGTGSSSWCRSGKFISCPLYRRVLQRLECLHHEVKEPPLERPLAMSARGSARSRHHGSTDHGRRSHGKPRHNRGNPVDPGDTAAMIG